VRKTPWSGIGAGRTLVRMALSSRDYERMLDLAVGLAGSTTPELDWPWLTAELK
jgi:hypothetical protein